MSDCVYDIFRSCAKDGNLAVTFQLNWKEETCSFINAD